jgi:hypothetical protein
MEVGQGPNWGCSAKEKKVIKMSQYFQESLDATVLDAKWSVLHETVEADLILGKIFKDSSKNLHKITRFNWKCL